MTTTTQREAPPAATEAAPTKTRRATKAAVTKTPPATNAAPTTPPATKPPPATKAAATKNPSATKASPATNAGATNAPPATNAAAAETPPATEASATATTPARTALRDADRRAGRFRRRRQAPGATASDVLAGVERVRSWIPAWRRAVRAVLAETTKKAKNAAALRRALATAQHARLESAPWSPEAACAEFRNLASSSGGLSPRELVGEQAELLVVDLGEADTAWPTTLHVRPSGRPDYKAVAADAEHAIAALQATLQHALVLTFLQDAKGNRVGSACDFDDYCKGWDLTPAQVDTAWLWLTHDPRMFDDKPLPLVLDGTGKHRVYRKAVTWSPLWFLTTLTPLWGAALVYGLVAALFFVLNQAGLTQWPHDWGVKMVILVLFIALGAMAHVASRSLSAISYDDPLQVYVAGQALDWLSLRWLAILRDYIPILVVAATLWGAGTIPTKFQDLATALLSGYSADSLFKAGLSKLQAQSTGSNGTTPTPAPSAVQSTTAPPTAQQTAVGPPAATAAAVPGV